MEQCENGFSDDFTYHLVRCTLELSHGTSGVVEVCLVGGRRTGTSPIVGRAADLVDDRCKAGYLDWLIQKDLWTVGNSELDLQCMVGVARSDS